MPLPAKQSIHPPCRETMDISVEGNDIVQGIFIGGILRMNMTYVTFKTVKHDRLLGQRPGHRRADNIDDAGLGFNIVVHRQRDGWATIRQQPVFRRVVGQEYELTIYGIHHNFSCTKRLEHANRSTHAPSLRTSAENVA